MSGVIEAALITAAASAVSAGIGYMGAQSANQANQSINAGTMAYNWAAQQSAADRSVDMMRETSERNRYDAAVSREWQDARFNDAINFARENRHWTETMSNTAYQRAMSDMRSAGLNPILAYQQGGASTPTAGGVNAPSGATASASGSSPGAIGAGTMQRMENTLGPALNSAMQGARVITDLRQAGASLSQTEANTALQQAQEAQSRSATSLNSAQTISELRRADLISNQAATSAAEPALRAAQTSAANSQSALAVEQRESERELQSLRREQARLAAEQANQSRQGQQANETYGRVGAGYLEQTSQPVSALSRSLGLRP